MWFMREALSSNDFFTIFLAELVFGYKMFVDNIIDVIRCDFQ